MRLKRTLFAGSVPEEDELANMQELGRELDREKSIMQENRLFAEDEERRKALAHTFSAGLPEQAELLSRKEQISRYKEVQGELAASRLPGKKRNVCRFCRKPIRRAWRKKKKSTICWQTGTAKRR